MMTGNPAKLLIFDPSRCTACHYCEIACSYSHLREIDLAKANLHLAFEPGTGRREMVHCMHCDNSLCLEACPSGAIYRDPESNHVLVNSMKCIGCKSCVAACPTGAAWFHETEASARKCDFCDGDPKCARFCSPGAMRVIDRKDYLPEFRIIGGGGSG